MSTTKGDAQLTLSLLSLKSVEFTFSSHPSTLTHTWYDVMLDIYRILNLTV